MYVCDTTFIYSIKMTHLKESNIKDTKNMVQKMKFKGKPGRKDYGQSHMTPEKIKAAIKSTQSMGQAAIYMGVSKNTFKKYAKQYNLYAPLQSSKGIRRSNSGAFAWDLKLILEGKNPNPYREDTLLTKAIREGYMKCQCNNCNQDFQDIKDKQPPLILDFLDKNPQNTRIDNLRLLCFNCIYRLNQSNRGWYRHRDTAIGRALDQATPVISNKDMDNVVRKTKNQAIEQSGTVLPPGDASSDNEEAPVAIPQDQEIEYMAFEEFQKLL